MQQKKTAITIADSVIGFDSILPVDHARKFINRILEGKRNFSNNKYSINTKIQMKQLLMGIILTLGFCAALNAQQVKSNSEVTITLSYHNETNIGGGIFCMLEFQNHTSAQLNIEISINGSVYSVVSVSPYIMAYQIPAIPKATIECRVLNGGKKDQLEFKLNNSDHS